MLLDTKLIEQEHYQDKQFFSNVSFASYANRAAATTAITVPNGARAGNTYLYYNQATFAIEGVRL